MAATSVGHHADWGYRSESVMLEIFMVISNSLAQTKGSVVYRHMYWSPVVPCPPDSLFVHTSLKTVMHEGLDINLDIHL